MQDTPAVRSNKSWTRTDVVRSVWRQCLFIIWAAWWGGLCFYAVVVVPIGTALIGTLEQGFITQQVTQCHNGLSFVFLICLLIEASYRQCSRVLWSVGAVLAIIDVGLVAWHFHLTAMMDFQHQSVPSNFYSAHAIYLWMTAVEWSIGMVIPIWLFATVAVSGESRPVGDH